MSPPFLSSFFTMKTSHDLVLIGYWIPGGERFRSRRIGREGYQWSDRGSSESVGGVVRFLAFSGGAGEVVASLFQDHQVSLRVSLPGDDIALFGSSQLTRRT